MAVQTLIKGIYQAYSCLSFIQEAYLGPFQTSVMQRLCKHS